MERALRSNCGDIYKIFLLRTRVYTREFEVFQAFLALSLSLSRLESPKRSKDKTIQGGARVNSFKNPNVQSAFEGYGIEGTVSLCSYPPGMRTRLDFLISKGRRDSCVDPQLFRSCGSRVPLSLNASSYLVNQRLERESREFDTKRLFSYSTKFVSREEISILPYCLLPISTLL